MTAPMPPTGFVLSCSVLRLESIMCVRVCASVYVDVRGRASVRDTYAKFKFTVYLHELLYYNFIFEITYSIMALFSITIYFALWVTCAVFLEFFVGAPLSTPCTFLTRTSTSTSSSTPPPSFDLTAVQYATTA